MRRCFAKQRSSESIIGLFNASETESRVRLSVFGGLCRDSKLQDASKGYSEALPRSGDAAP